MENPAEKGRLEKKKKKLVWMSRRLDNKMVNWSHILLFESERARVLLTICQHLSAAIFTKKTCGQRATF